jgi:geranylgeranyl diphosphate synthase type II
MTMLLTLYQNRFENALQTAIEQMGEKTVLRDACAFSLQGGKRIRPLLVLMIADALELGQNVMPSALSVEFFHTASLIADDLPCMDNDSVRRNRPTLHIAFGESVAILASYALIAAGYGGVADNGKILRLSPSLASEADQRSMLCLEALTRAAGIHGATQGQFLDLFPPDSSFETMQDIIYKKTVTLFEISFLFGWIFGGGELARLPEVKQAARHLGMAFQIADDLDDSTQDACHEGSVNISAVLGKEKAISLFHQEITALEKSLSSLGLWTQPFQELFYKLSSINIP